MRWAPHERGTHMENGAEHIYKYHAFISYNRAQDMMFCRDFHRELQKMDKPWYKRRNICAFRDEYDLSADPDLWSSIETALRGSEWLVLFLSPDAANSQWVNKEITWWKDNRDADHILLVLTAGELITKPDLSGLDSDSSTAYPSALGVCFAAVPNYVDARQTKKTDKNSREYRKLLRDNVAAVSAKLLNKSKSDIISDDIKQHKKNKIMVVFFALLGLVLITLLFIAIKGASVQRANAVDSQRIAHSKQLSDEALYLANKNPRLAAAYALTAAMLDNSDEAIRAEQFVAENNRYVTNTALVSEESICSVATDGNIILVSDATAEITILQSPSLRVNGKIPIENANAKLCYNRIEDVFIALDGADLVFIKSVEGAEITVVSRIKTGIQSQYRYGPYIDSSGGVLVLSRDLEAVYCPTPSTEIERFNFRNSQSIYKNHNIEAASGFQYTDYGRELFYVATTTNEVLSLHLNRSGEVFENASLEFEFSNTRGSRITSLQCGYNDSLFVGTTAGLALWKTNESLNREDSYPYGGVSDEVIETACFDNIPLTAILTIRGVTMIGEDSALAISGHEQTGTVYMPVTTTCVSPHDTIIIGRSNGTVVTIDPKNKPLSSGELLSSSSAHCASTDGSFLISVGRQQYSDGFGQYQMKPSDNGYELKQTGLYPISVELNRAGFYLNSVVSANNVVVAGGKRQPNSGQGVVLVWKDIGRDPSLILDFPAESFSGGGSDMVSAVAYSPELHRIAGFHLLQGALAIWDSNTGERLQTIQIRKDPNGELPNAVNLMNATSDGKMLLVTADGEATIIDMETGTIKSSFASQGSRAFLAPNGETIALVCSSRKKCNKRARKSAAVPST